VYGLGQITHTLTIEDDDTVPTPGFTLSLSNVTEGNVATIQVSLDREYNTAVVFKVSERVAHTGTDDSGGTSATVLTDSGALFLTNTDSLTPPEVSNVQVGDIVTNITDGSTGTVTFIGGDTTLTCGGGLSGGTLNIFSNGDSYSVGTDALSSEWDFAGDPAPAFATVTIPAHTLTGTFQVSTSDAAATRQLHLKFSTDL
jgi:hypothetical protein